MFYNFSSTYPKYTPNSSARQLLVFIKEKITTIRLIFCYNSNIVLIYYEKQVIVIKNVTGVNMKKIIVTWIIGVLLLSSFTITSVSNDSQNTVNTNSNGNKLYVGGSGPGNYSSIQDAIDNTTPGDTIYVYPGFYQENLVIDKSIQLIGHNKTTTIIDGSKTDNTLLIYDTSYVAVTQFTIQNSGNDSGHCAGIYVIWSNYNTIYDNIISNNFFGILITSYSFNTISDNNISSNDHDGIYIISDYNNITNNIVNSNQEYGMLISGDYNNITNNIANSNSNYDGICISGDYNNITNNIANSNYENGISIKSDNNNVKGNNVSSNGYFGGIMLDGDSNNVEKNNIRSNNIEGIYIMGGYDNIIINNNIISNHQNGIQIYGLSTGNKIINNNIISNHENGIFIFFTNVGNNIIGNNISSNNADGIYIMGGYNNNITNNNIISNHQNGIMATDGNSNNIEENNISSNYDSGINFFSSSSDNKVSNNIISNNDLGIEIRSSCENNIIYNNYFDNFENFDVNTIWEKTNTWNISKTPGINIVGGPFLGGNYWNDYTGIDGNGDGLGDTPYKISTKQQDNYPLMLYTNYVPYPPNVDGQTNGQVGVEYEYTFSSDDPDGDNLSYYVDWGDGTNSGWLGPYISGVQASANHSWNQKGTYIIKVKAKDVHGAVSDWGSLTVTIPKNQAQSIPQQNQQSSQQQSQQSQSQQMMVPQQTVLRGLLINN